MTGPYILTVADDADLDRLLGDLARGGFWARRLESSHGAGPRMLEIDARSRQAGVDELASLPGVAAVAHRPSGHPRLDAKAGVAVDLDGLLIGPGAPPVLMAGPCAVESERQIMELAESVARAGGRVLRGSAYKPRTSPYAFSGRGPEALGWLRAAADRHGLLVVTEALSEAHVERVAEVADLIQIGSRNMQNFALLKKVGEQKQPVLLKRGMAASVEDWLLAAEHCLAAGARDVILCERGLRGFDPITRNLLDLGAVAHVAHSLRLPIVVDPSHAAGRRDLVPPLAHAALAAGAHGLLVETHDDAAAALSDGPQALDPAGLSSLLPVRA